jgi:voltage-gated potassium channel
MHGSQFIGLLRFMRGFGNSATARRITVVVTLFILLMVFGTAGYMLVEHYTFIEALYMTVITLSTVGFTEVHPLDTGGKVFTIILILLGVSFVAFALAYFSQILLDGNLLEAYRRHKLKKRLDQLENHYIICGYGEMGRIVAEELHKHKIPVVIIESDESVLALLRERNFLHIGADATDENSLSAAGVLRAKGLVAVVNKDSENVFIVLTARDLNRDLTIFARADTPGADKRLLKAGANRVVSPYVIGATQIAYNILRPTVTHFLELALSEEGIELRMEEIHIPEGSKLVGKKLVSSGIRSNYDLIVVAIKHAEGGMVFNPPPQEQLKAGDILVAIGAIQNLSRLEQELNAAGGRPYEQ